MHLIAGRQRNPSPCRKPRSAVSFSSEGGACTRYTQGRVGRSSSSAAATFARTMNARSAGPVEAWPRRDRQHLAFRTSSVTLRSGKSRSRVPRSDAAPPSNARNASYIARRGSTTRSPLVSAACCTCSYVNGRRCASTRGRNDARVYGRWRRCAFPTNRQPRSSFGPQAAAAVGQFLGQHRHDAIRKVDRCCRACRAARSSGAAGPHVPSATSAIATIRRRPSRLFPEHGVVEIARVLPVDGDQRNVAQVPPFPLPDRLGLPAPRSRASSGNPDRNVVRVDGDQADRLRVAHFAEPLDDTRGFEAEPAMRQWFGQHQFVGLRAGLWPRGTVHSALARRSVGMMRPSGCPGR